MSDYICKICNKVFRDGRDLNRHESRKTSCAPIVAPPKGDKFPCKYCNRGFSSKTAMYRHIRQTCKIAGSEEGMNKLVEHALARQLASAVAQYQNDKNVNAAALESIQEQICELKMHIDRIQPAHVAAAVDDKEQNATPPQEETSETILESLSSSIRRVFN